MELAKNAPSVWPGYVAAVASLVLSLLLLLAILVFAMTQVGNIVSNYMQEVIKNTWLAEQAELARAAQAAIAKPGLSPVAVRHDNRVVFLRDPVLARAPDPTLTRAPAPTLAQAPEPGRESASPTQRNILLVFSPHVDSLTPAQRQQFANALKQLQAPDHSKWQVSSTVLASDPLMEKTSYRLVLLVRDVLLSLGLNTQNIQLQLVPSDVPPQGYQRGETVVRVSPVVVAPSTGERP
jgi:Na+-transporting methylmalonyl-CoA/oxaloacetate decarboxylase gamma subunit